MPVLLIAGLALVATAPAPAPQTRCPPPGPQIVEAALAAPHRLDTPPPASLYLALDRRIDACPAPIIIRSDIGSRGK